MSNAETMGPGNRVVMFCLSGDKKLDSPATESSVRQTCNVLTQTCAHDQTRGFQHFEHACEQFQIHLNLICLIAYLGHPSDQDIAELQLFFPPS